jgi:hypothetical protein
MLVRSGVLAVGVGAGIAVVGYLTVGRKPCLTWGATAADIDRPMPGDDLLPDPDLFSTRAVRVQAPPSAIWPWLMQMGSGKGGVYTYDWIENLFGLNMHSVDVILPQFQERSVGDVELLGKHGPRLRVEILDPQSAIVLRSEDENWVWAFGLYPRPDGRTALVSRNRIRTPDAPALLRAFNVMVMEPGSLVMERKMLLGIKLRAERLAAERLAAERLAAEGLGAQPGTTDARNV